MKRDHTFRLSEERGFTLVEVFTVMTITLVIALIGTPALRSWIPNLHFRDAASNLLLDLNLAKITAIKRHAEVTVSFSNASYSCGSLSSSDYGGNSCSYTIWSTDDDGNTATIKKVTLPSHVALCDSTFASDITFKETGLPDLSTQAELSIKNDKSRQAVLAVNLVGNISLN